MASDFLVKDEIRFETPSVLVRPSEGMVSDEEKQNEVVDDEDKEPRTVVEARNWAELQGDVLLLIFKKIAAAEILRSAQFVCRPWRKLSHEPALWRRIDMRIEFSDKMESMAMMAVDRSQGCVEELYVEDFPITKLLRHISERATQLRCLHLISVDLYNSLLGTVIKFPHLEELEISHCSISNKVIERIAEACPQLKIFRHDARPFGYEFGSVPDANANTEAFTIAKHMPQLRHLQLFANDLTNNGLLAILNSCPYLEHLDVRKCFFVRLDENLKKKCAGIKVLRLPNDSTEDYEYQAIIDELDAYDAEYYPMDCHCTFSESGDDTQVDDRMIFNYYSQL